MFACMQNKQAANPTQARQQSNQPDPTQPSRGAAPSDVPSHGLGHFLSIPSQTRTKLSWGGLFDNAYLTMPILLCILRLSLLSLSPLSLSPLSISPLILSPLSLSPWCLSPLSQVAHQRVDGLVWVPSYFLAEPPRRSPDVLVLNRLRLSLSPLSLSAHRAS